MDPTDCLIIHEPSVIRGISLKVLLRLASASLLPPPAKNLARSSRASEFQTRFKQNTARGTVSCLTLADPAGLKTEPLTWYCLLRTWWIPALETHG